MRVKPESTYETIYRVVRRIPRGKVATYGQVAKLAGIAGHSRQVGYALHVLPSRSNVPWQRVINAKGEISRRATGNGASRQRALLEEEGIVFDEDDRISLRLYGWFPARDRGKKERNE